MIKWILKELEKNPAEVFHKKDLLKQSKEQFEALKKLKLLTYIQPDLDCETYSCSLPCSKSCPMDIVEMDNELFAICPQDSDIDPIPLKRDELNKYQFCIKEFLEQIHSANKLSGPVQEIKPNYLYFGYKMYNNHRIGFVFGFDITTESMLELTGLKNLCLDDDYLVIFSPDSSIEDISLKQTLSKECIRQLSLTSSLNLETYKFAVDEIVSEILEQIPKTKNKKKVGRPKVTIEEAQKRRKLKTDWERAAEVRISKSEFCEDNDIDVEYLNNSVLRWCRDHLK